jgi:5'-3' exonuclease
MGVPKFFAWLMKKYKNSNFIFYKEKSDDEIVKSIDWLLLDTNCLIHPVCFKILAEESDKPNINKDVLENKMINAVIEYIDKIVKYTDPKKGIYLAIDGPVCSAKMKQQRQRRFRSYHDKLLFDSIKKKHNITETYFWSNSAISPGTEFMYKLHVKILEWCKIQSVKVLYSSSNTAGEGEHKLLDFIKKNNKYKKSLSYVTYGLDADLIFLMLVTKLDNVYLLREAQQFDNCKDDRLNYVSIKIMKDCILDSFQTNLNSYLKFNKTRIINDFIFLCYFLGNDFLPHIHALDIYNRGIEDLIITYIESFRELYIIDHTIDSTINSNIDHTINSNIDHTINDNYLLSEDTLTINNIFLQKFINKLALNENAILTKNFNRKKPFYHYRNTEPYKKEIEKIENLLFKIEDPIGIGVNSDYRFKYYNHYFGVNKDNIEDFVKELVKNYLIGIRWSTYYYFQKIPDWNWFYPYDQPPFLIDIDKYMIDMNDIKFKKGKPITPLEQLLIVLPSQMNYLLPIPLRNLTINSNSPLIHLYPTKINIDFLYKHKYFEGIPKLPLMDIKLINIVFKKNQNKLAINDKQRNRIDKIFKFN